MSDDTEVFCNNCYAGMESDEHHEKCVRPREELRTRIADAISEADNEFTILGDDYGAAPNLTAIADAVIDALGLTVETEPGHDPRECGCSSRAYPAESRVVGKWEER